MNKFEKHKDAKYKYPITRELDFTEWVVDTFPSGVAAP